MKRSTQKHFFMFSLVSTAALYVIIMLGVVYKLPAFAYDDLVGGFVRLYFSPAALPTMLFITNIASPVILLGIFLVAFAFLIWRRRGYYDLVLMFAAATGGILVVFFKWLLNVSRPISSLVPTFDASFPSGHTAMSTIIFLVIAYAFRHEIKNASLRWFFEAVCFAIIVLIAVSRIYLGAHRPSEVVAGFALGIFCVTLSMFLFRHLETRTHQAQKNLQ